MEDFAKLIKKIDDFFRDFFDMRESYFMTRLPSVPLEFPKLANAQLSNFGPLRIFFFHFTPKMVKVVKVKSIFNLKKMFLFYETF